MRGWVGATAIGGRSENQDAFQTGRTGNGSGRLERVAAVCDGIGAGARSGEAALGAAIGFVQACTALGPVPAPERLTAAANVANGAVRDVVEQGGTDSNTGTTLAAAAIGPKGLTWISIGDSLIYHWRPAAAGPGTLRRLNPLHDGPRRNMLTSALCGEPIPLTALPDPPWTELEPGDVVVVASDGVETLQESEIEASIRRERRAAAGRIRHRPETGGRRAGQGPGAPGQRDGRRRPGNGRLTSRPDRRRPRT